MNKKKIVIFYGREIGKNILKILNKDKNIDSIKNIHKKN